MLTDARMRNGVVERHSCCRVNAYAGWGLAVMALVFVLFPTSASADGLGYDGLPPQELCGLCHGLSGISATAKFPKLAGQKVGYIEKQLRDILAGRRTNDGGQMVSVITEIRPDQFPAVAKYFSLQKPPPPQENDASDVSADALIRAASIYENGKPHVGVPACKSCHGPGPRSLPAAPHLSAQHSGYIEKQLSDFRTNTRSNDTGSTMRQIAAKLSVDESRALAAYLASLPRNGS
ncbi:MAG: c-type cytochrome [Hyphomicrobiaceae bacterium]